MYKRHLNQISLLDEPEYFGGIALDPDNEWVKIAKLIPWYRFEEEYSDSFSSETGQPACSFKMALGSLLIKERYQFSDEETVAHITMNPYLQYFIGLKAFTHKSPFDSSMMSRFRTTTNLTTLRMEDFLVVHGLMIKKRTLRQYLEGLGLSKAVILEKNREIREKSTCGRVSCGLEGVYFYASDVKKYSEAPINIVIAKRILENNASAYYDIFPDDLRRLR